MSYLGVLAILTLLILVHELGHLWAARLNGIPVERFSIGVGPTLWTHRGRHMELRLAAIPLGGYVLPRIESEQELFALPLRSRILFYLAGPAANLALAWLGLGLLDAWSAGPSFHALLVEPWLQLGSLCAQMGMALSALVSEPTALSGALGIVTEGSRFVATGLEGSLRLMILLSVNLAVLNLLPIPGLDGGKILLHLMQACWPRSLRLHAPLTLIGLLLLFGVMGYATLQDLTRLLA